MPKPNKGPAPQNARAQGFPDLPHMPELPNHRSENMSINDILNQAHSALEAASAALRGLEGGPTVSKMANLRQAVVEIRRSTLVLQKLRTRVGGWDDWYGPLQDSMKNDALMRYFVDLRNQIEKEGIPAVLAEICNRASGQVIADVSVYEDGFGVAVAGAVRPGFDPAHANLESSTNIDDTDFALCNFRLTDPPISHLGEPLTDFRFGSLAELAIKYLHEHVVNPAREKFGE